MQLPRLLKTKQSLLSLPESTTPSPLSCGSVWATACLAWLTETLTSSDRASRWGEDTLYLWSTCRSRLADYWKMKTKCVCSLSYLIRALVDYQLGNARSVYAMLVKHRTKVEHIFCVFTLSKWTRINWAKRVRIMWRWWNIECNVSRHWTETQILQLPQVPFADDCRLWGRQSL